tara:strand:- start:57 stop:377 length:321 start_codon:yes stop_codon:yes gene_type:complete
MIEVVHKGFDNPNKITIEEDGAAIDFSAVTRMVLSFEGSTVAADTSIDSALIDWSQGNGVVEFSINDLALCGHHAATLIAFDASHVDGQVLVHMDDRALVFSFMDA